MWAHLVFWFLLLFQGTAVAQWLRWCATNRKVAGSIPAGVSGFFHLYKIFPSKGSYTSRWQPCHHPVPLSRNLVNLNFLEPFGPIQACNGIALPLPLLLFILAMFRIFLSSFARLRKADVGCVMSVCLSVRMEQFGSHLKDFHEILYIRIIRRSAEKMYCMQAGELLWSLKGIFVKTVLVLTIL